MKAIGVPFVWAIFLAVCVATIGFLLLGHLIGSYWQWVAVFCAYTIINAYVDANNLLAKRLGRKAGFSVSRQSRMIPVGGYGVFENSIGQRSKKRQISVTDGVSLITSDGETIFWEDIKRFIRKSYVRQERGKPPFSRKYWTRDIRPVLSVKVYETIIEFLLEGGFIVGRRSGYSGRFNKTSEQIIMEIE